MVKEMIGGCCVCSDERGWDENPLVYCDGHGCNVAVHQGKYNLPLEDSLQDLNLFLMIYSCAFINHQHVMASCKFLKDRGFVGNANRRKESLEW